MDLLFCCYRSNQTEDSTPPPCEIRFTPRANRGPPPDASHDGCACSYDGQSSDGYQPKSSTAAAKPTSSSRTTRRGNNTTRLGKYTASIGPTLVNQSQSLLVRKLLSLMLTWALMLRSSREPERKTSTKKASRTPANNSGKRSLAVMHEAGEPYGSDGCPEPPRNVALQLAGIDAGIEVEPETDDGEHNLSRQLADRRSPTNTPSPFTPTPGHHHASAARELAEARMSAAEPLLLASGAELPVNTLATEGDMPCRSHCPSDPCIGNVCADIPTAEDVRRELCPPAHSPTNSSPYHRPGKFR